MPLRGTWTGFFRQHRPRATRATRHPLPAMSLASTTCSTASASASSRWASLPERVLVHGDFYPQNVMVDDGGRVTGVIDFGGNTLLGDQRMDVASAVILRRNLDKYRKPMRWTLPLMDEARRRYGAGLSDVVEAYRGYYALHFSGGSQDYAWCVDVLRAIGA